MFCEGLAGLRSFRSAEVDSFEFSAAGKRAGPGAAESVIFRVLVCIVLKDECGCFECIAFFLAVFAFLEFLESLLS